MKNFKKTHAEFRIRTMSLTAIIIGSVAIAAFATMMLTIDDDSAFENWAKQGNIDYQFDFEKRGNDRIAVASRDIKAGDYVLTVPRDRYFTSGDALISGMALNGLSVEDQSQLSHLASTVLSAGKREELVLASILLYHKRNNNSMWTPYLNILPASVSGLPRNMNGQALEILRDTLTFNAYTARLNDLKREYSYVSMFFEFELEDYLTARETVDSRCFYLQQLGEPYKLAMVPVADFPNHENDKCSLSNQVDAQGTLYGVSQCSFKKGDIISNFYGQWGNRDLLGQYGFAVKKNPFDYNTIVLPDKSRCKVYREPRKGIQECLQALSPFYNEPQARAFVKEYALMKLQNLKHKQDMRESDDAGVQSAIQAVRSESEVWALSI